MARHIGSPAADRRTRWLVVASVLLVLAGASGLGVALVRSSAAGDASARTSTTEGTEGEGFRTVDWVEVLGRLDARRSRAFAAGDVSALDQVYAEGTAALRSDRRLLRRYLDRGLRVTGLWMRVVDVRLLDVDGTRTLLRVRDRVNGGQVVDARGTTWPLREDAWSTHRIVLERGDHGWRISDLRRVD